MKMLGRAMIAVMGLSVASCGQIGDPIDVLQGNVKAPDEFEVVARKPLRMPRSLNLPVPQLGAPSPLDPTPRADAAAALLGAAPGATPGGVSAGEAALLAAANANASNPEIRTVLEEDKTRIDPNRPYEAPTLSELLGVGDEDEPVDALDPNAEARRLQSEGVAPAPVNPNDPGELERKTSTGGS